MSSSRHTGRNPHERPHIGWREWLALPELGIDQIKAKVDTGARSSALHAFDLEIATEGGISIVRFKVHPLQRDAATTVDCQAELLELRKVRNSGGIETIRPVVRTMVSIGGVRWPIDLTLVGRDTMGFRMLLGREATRGRFLVNPGRSYLFGKPEQRH